MSRGARALTLFGAMLQRIYEAQPQLRGISASDHWNLDPARFRGLDRDKIQMVAIMRHLEWIPKGTHFPEGLRGNYHTTETNAKTERFWLFALNNMTHTGLDDFVRFVETGSVEPASPATITFEVSDSDLEMLVIANAPKPTPAQWGTW